ncbi:MAG: DUF1232 domain-containing protein [Candidatus Ozemobacteraceae bacterium]
MTKSSFQIKVEEMLLKYITRFVRYARFAHLPQDRKELLIGTFLYLLDEQDLIPDDVPNIGYLDDLMVFVNVAAAFIQNGQSIPGVCSQEEVQEDLAFLDKNKGLLFGTHMLSVEVIQKKGKAAVNLPELADQIKIKYSNLGKVDA